MPYAKLIFGCGYLGSRVATLWRQSGNEVFAATRTAAKADKLRRGGLTPIIADVTQADAMRELPACDALLFAVGFDRAAAGDIHAVYAQGLANVLSAVGGAMPRVIYISTTGVYGSASGGWVDEETPPDPRREGGRASLAAEQVLTAHPLAGRSAILRLAGIYGPGRVPYLNQLRAGEPIPAPSSGWLNLIHVDDAATIIVALDQWLAEQPDADGPHVFCVSDGAPVVRGDYYAEVARLSGAPAPRFTAPPAGSPVAARAAADRRIRNDKLRQTLFVRLAYPSYREGLAAILGAGP